MSGQRPLDPAVARRVTGLAAATSLALATAMPVGHFWIARQREAATMRAEAKLLAQNVSAMVARNPDHWRFERVRIAALLVADAAGAPPGPRRVLDRHGATVAEAPAEVPGPRLEVREPVFDAGRAVGEVRIARSLRGVLAEAGFVAAVAAVFGLLAFASLRAVPLRLLRQALERANHLATHDPLTGLPNRARMREGLGRALAEARQGGETVAVLLVDLDRFKPVNDVHGHHAGDRLLRGVAERLRAALRGTDGAARLGGDEFALVARFEAGGAAPREAAARLAGRVVSALETPFDLAGVGAVQVGCSVGVALAAPGDEEEVEALIGRADAAMYRAKAEGRGCFRFFEPGMDERIRERAALATDLRAAVLADALEPHFQPLVDLGTGRLVGFEMLARWTHPLRGQVSPAEFVPIAEDTGLIGPMTERLLRRACLAAAEWPEGVTLACNISPLQLRDRGLPGIVRAALAESRLPPGRLEIELTESALLDDFGLARDILGELKALGVRLALDDFGTGYSSLRHLQALPIDKIKIDAGFVRSMAESAESRKIVAAVVGLGQSLGLPTVAEGVEDAASAHLLAGLGCTVGQGWLFGRAVPGGEAAELVAGFARAAAARAEEPVACPA
ncbi:hypothetical protein GCM10009416_10340 [Craurococcus roseus]|uniref:EAL domain-containing protein n=1 Tax=Craurococcus roseus TaxID=77585 RepID=A0ABN1EU32_9PROT